MTAAEIWTTIKDFVWIAALPISLTLGVLNAYFGGGWGQRGLSWTFAVTRKQNLTRLRKRRAYLTEMRDCDRAYYGMLLSSSLIVLTIFAVELFVRGDIPPHAPYRAEAMAVTQYVCGLIAFLFAMGRLSEYRTFQKLPEIIARLNREIARREKSGNSPSTEMGKERHAS